MFISFKRVRIYGYPFAGGLLLLASAITPIAPDMATHCDLFAVLDSCVLRNPVVLASGSIFCHSCISRSCSGLSDDMLQVIVIQQ